MTNNNQTAYLTKEKYDELTKELHELETKKRMEIAKDLEYAKSLGDLSENAEYHEAREAQASLEDRIAKITIMLKHASIVESHHSSKVEVGSTVILKKSGDKNQLKMRIVGSEEADVASGKISNSSPIGKAMLGKKKGDSFEVPTPKGKIEYTVVGIE